MADKVPQWEDIEEILEPESEQGEDVPQWEDIVEVLEPSEDVPKEEKPKPGYIESAARGFASGLSSDFDDEILARAQALSSDNYGEALPEKLKGVRDDKKAAYNENPITYTGSQIAGAIVSPINKVLGPAKGLSYLRNLGRAGTAAGAFAAGASEENPLESPSKFAGDVAIGYGTGAIGQGIVSGIGQVAKAMTPEALKKFAQERAFKGSTGQNKRAIKNALQMKQLHKTGSDLLEGIPELDIPPTVGFGTSIDEINRRAGEHANKAWENVQRIQKNIDQKTAGQSVDAFEIGLDIWKRAESIPPLSNAAITAKNSMMEVADRLLNQGKISLEQAQKYKNQFLFKMADSRTHALGQDGANQIRKAFTKSINNAVEKFGDDAERALYPKAMNAYGSMATASKEASDRAAANLSNRFISPSDYGMGIGAGMASASQESSGAVQGIASALAHKLLRERGSTAAAYTANKLSDLIAKNPKTLGAFRKFLEQSSVNKAPAFYTPLINQSMQSGDP